MTLAEIVSATFRFHRAAYVSLTEKCPIQCRHCFVESGPKRTEHAPYAEFRSWIESVVASPHIAVVFLSGGEPFSHPSALRYALDVAKVYQKYAVVCTSALWARSPSIADSVLERFPSFGCLWLSTDIFHEEFVPLRQLRWAALAARRRGIDVACQIVDDEPESSDFLDRFEREVGSDAIDASQIYVAPLALAGRAKELRAPDNVHGTDRSEDALRSVPDAPCPWMGTPWIREDGVVCACPSLHVFRESTHPLHIGNLRHESFEQISQRADGDLYLQALRTLGPKGIARRYRAQKWGWKPAEFAGQTICDLCHSLAKVPGLPDELRSELGGEQQASKVGALRAAIYFESPRPKGAPVR